jgi:hypothetical protein
MLKNNIIDIKYMLVSNQSPIDKQIIHLKSVI